MPTIQCLDPHVADLIAAGEVVERPASVVKELTENAIDAGAHLVVIEIQNGGMGYIRVTDDGCGIAAEQVETAFLRHATSKIRSEYDLEAIGTLGFRGEALAAIAAVSLVELLTHAEGETNGTSVVLRGGVVEEHEEAGCPKGTTMIVRNLFYNTPARLKFMKRDSAEGAAVFAAVQHIALSHPEVSFRFLREGKEELFTPGDCKLESAMYAVLGRETALSFLPCKGSGENDMMVEGFVSRPSCCRGTRGYQNFFINGRYVKSKTLMAAVEQAYQNTKMVGKFPACVLHLKTKLSVVDVNVHPAKTEVKVFGEKLAFDMVYYAVMAALNDEEGHLQPAEKPKPKPQPEPTKPNQTFFQTMTAQTFRKTHSAEEVKPKQEQFQDSTATVYQTRPRPEPGLPNQPRRRVRPSVGEAGGERPDLAALFSGYETAKAERVRPKPEPERPAAQPPMVTPIPKPEEAPAQPEPQQSQVITEGIVPQWRMVGEVLKTYIIVEQGERVYLIDKHAAHERMNFDKLKAQDYQPMRQMLLTPVSFTPTPEEGAVLLAHLPLLEEFGFAAEDFGDGSLLVREMPDYLEPGQVEESLCELAEQLRTTGSADPSAARDALLHTMACKAAIKSGWQNDREELMAVAEAVMNGSVKYCPHGRPVAIELDKGWVDRQFKR